MKLDLGCGSRKREGAVGADIIPGSSADVVCNLNGASYPFKENSFDEIYAVDVIEHLDDTLKTVEEIYRISKPGAIVHIVSPHFSSHNFYSDITHKRAFGVRSFDFFSEQESSVVKYLPVRARFRIVEKIIEPNKFIFKCNGRWIKIRNLPMKFIVNLSPFMQDVYERFFAFIFTAEGVRFRLEAIK